MNFQPHSDLNNPKRERERATEESNRHTSFGRRASSVHHSSSAVQALSTIYRPSCKLHPPSLFFSSLILSLSLWPTKAESLTTCHWSTTHHPSLPSLLPLDRTTDLVTQTPNSIAFLTILPPPLPIFFSQAISLQLFHNWYSVWGRGPIFFFLVSTPTPNLSDLAVAVLHPLQSLSFPQSLTLSSSSQRVYYVYVVNKCFYFDFLLC